MLGHLARSLCCQNLCSSYYHMPPSPSKTQKQKSLSRVHGCNHSNSLPWLQPALGLVDLYWKVHLCWQRYKSSLHWKPNQWFRAPVASLCFLWLLATTTSRQCITFKKMWPRSHPFCCQALHLPISWQLPCLCHYTALVLFVVSNMKSKHI